GGTRADERWADRELRVAGAGVVPRHPGGVRADRGAAVPADRLIEGGAGGGRGHRANACAYTPCGRTFGSERGRLGHQGSGGRQDRQEAFAAEPEAEAGDEEAEARRQPGGVAVVDPDVVAAPASLVVPIDPERTRRSSRSAG